MMSHSAFVLLSYGTSIAIFGVVVAWLLIDRAATMADLERLERAGVKRRSEAAKDETIQ